MIVLTLIIRLLELYQSLFRKEHYIEHQNILTAIHDQNCSVNLPSGSRQGKLLLFPFNKLYSNMKVIPQYKLIGLYNYDRIIRNIGKIYAKRRAEL